MGLESVDAIQKFRDVLDFMGYATLQSISKLQRMKDLDKFQIEASKLRTNVTFCEKFPYLKNWSMGHGDISVLKDIAEAASRCNSDKSSASHMENVLDSVYAKCQKVFELFVQLIK